MKKKIGPWCLSEESPLILQTAMVFLFGGKACGGSGSGGGCDVLVYSPCVNAHELSHI